MSRLLRYASGTWYQWHMVMPNQFSLNGTMKASCREEAKFKLQNDYLLYELVFYR